MDRLARLASAKRAEGGPEAGMVCDRRVGEFAKAPTAPYRHYRKSKEQQPCDSGFPRKGPTGIPLRPAGVGHAVTTGNQYLAEDEGANRWRVGQQLHWKGRDRAAARDPLRRLPCWPELRAGPAG